MSNCPTPQKISYVNEDMAIRFGVQARMRWYHCPCTKWHLTTSAVDFSYIDQIEASIKQHEKDAKKKAVQEKKAAAFTPIAVGTTVEHKLYGIGVVRYIMPAKSKAPAGKTVKCTWLEHHDAIHKIVHVNTLKTLTDEEARKMTQVLTVHI